MRQFLHHKRFQYLIKSIDLKLNNLPESYLYYCSELFYPDENKQRLSDLELKKLIEKIEENFKDSDEESFRLLLRMYMNKNKIKAQALYNAALIEKSYFYQILKGRHIPSRDTAIRIVVGLQINLEESKILLQTLGYNFFEKSRRDIIITECIAKKTGMYVIELLLDRYGEASLCNSSILSCR